ncbi:hypothetical protein RHOFW510R12_02580 [Rhodanobacter sp. FW510-R12]
MPASCGQFDGHAIAIRDSRGQCPQAGITLGQFTTVMSCFGAQLRQTGLLSLQSFSRFDHLLFCAPLAFASCIDLLQHAGLGGLQPLVRCITFDLKSRIPARNHGLEFFGLVSLRLTDAFDLFGGVGLECDEFLLQCLAILKRLILRGGLELHSRLQRGDLLSKCFALFGQCR